MNILIPSSFVIPQEVRSALPGDIQTWLDSVESRIDGMTLEHIQDEAKELAGDSGNFLQLFKLGRRLFYDKMQRILDIMHPGLEVGIDVLWEADSDDNPGSAVVYALNDRGNIHDVPSFARAFRADLEEAAV